MKKNQTNIPEKPGREINKTSRLNGYSTMNTRVAVKDIRPRPADPLLLQLREMETQNDCLVELLDKRTDELEKFVAATTKSLSIIGHDLRGPVCTVLAALELLKQKLASNSPVGSELYITAALDSAKKTLTLLDNLLEWSVSKNNCSTFNPVKIDLNEFLKDEMVKVKTSIALKTITVDYSVDPGLKISGDVQMVRSIIRNLIGNAIKFTGYGGKIKVKARATGRLVEITISDNGVGMSSEQQKDILNNEDGIFKIPGSDGRIGGIGLKLCREFIESHGGIMQITSKPDKGSKFRFSLERID